jgi:hypothetical protein
MSALTNVVLTTIVDAVAPLVTVCTPLWHVYCTIARREASPSGVHNSGVSRTPGAYGG